VAGAAPSLEGPPLARLRSFDPYLVPVSLGLIVAAAGGLLYVLLALHRFTLAALLILGVPLVVCAALRSFLPKLLTADQNEIRWKEPFRTAQTVQRSDVVRIEQRMVGDSSGPSFVGDASYASFVDREGKERLFVGVFTPAQIASFAAAVGIPIREVTEAPPPGSELEAAVQRSDAEGRRAYWLTLSGSLVVAAIGLWILVAVMLDQYHQSFAAYQAAPNCDSPPPPNQDCRYRTAAVVSGVHTDRTGKPVMTLTFAADAFTSGPAKHRNVTLVTPPSPMPEEGASVQVEVWRHDLVTQVNGTETTDFRAAQSNANDGWVLLALAGVALGTIGVFIWVWRSKPT
jgi:hypothetical protein